ncbi:MAG: diaminopimelate decarboxylase, partial [Candidatus Dormibacteraceae bacterium]
MEVDSLTRLFPSTYTVNRLGHAEIGGCDLVEVAAEHGTPLYVYDELTVRQLCREYMEAMGSVGRVLYSAKAFSSPAFLRLVVEEGLGVDVVSAGELQLALAAGCPPELIHFLGNNKSRFDLERAVASGVVVVVDNLHDLELLRDIVPASRRLRCQVRVCPGVMPDTHGFIATGQIDSKFGLGIADGGVQVAVDQILGDDRLELIGLHFHMGSHISDLRSYLAAMEIMLDLVIELGRTSAWRPQFLDAGGGLAAPEAGMEFPPTPAQFVATLRQSLESGCQTREIETPQLVVEPGRSIAGPAAVALYTVGAIKDVPGGLRYVGIDGGMGDNIRPKLYGAKYTAVSAHQPLAETMQQVTIAGKYCESTDLLIEDVRLPQLKAGELLCVPACGAYT